MGNWGLSLDSFLPALDWWLLSLSAGDYRRNFRIPVVVMVRVSPLPGHGWASVKLVVEVGDGGDD